VATRAERRQATQNRLKAMQHPLRAEAFRLIRDSGPISPAEVSRRLEAELGDVSYHVRKLREFSCIEEVEHRLVRGAVEHFYRATEQHLVDTEEWGELADAEPLVAESLTDEFMQHIVDDYSTSRHASIVALDEEFHITRTPLILDPQGLADALEAAEKHRLHMAEIAAQSAARQIEEDTPEVRVSSSIALFKMPDEPEKKKAP
jgi:DNA-binding transcriptional ArsR family regulator